MLSLSLPGARTFVESNKYPKVEVLFLTPQHSSTCSSTNLVKPSLLLTRSTSCYRVLTFCPMSRRCEQIWLQTSYLSPRASLRPRHNLILSIVKMVQILAARSLKRAIAPIYVRATKLQNTEKRSTPLSFDTRPSDFNKTT